MLRRLPISARTEQRLPGSIVLTLILAVTLLAHFKGAFNGFVGWDDNLHIIYNPDITGLTARHLANIFSQAYIGMFQPLTTLSFAIEYHFAGFNPAVFHLTSIVFHVLNTALVYLLVLRLRPCVWLGAFVALMFGIHPMHVESVAWITERKDVLYAFFYLMALLAYLRHLDRGPRSRTWYLFSLLMFLCSALSKSAAVTLPVILVLVDYHRDRTFSWRGLAAKTPFFALSLAFGLISMYSQRDNVSWGQELLGRFSVLERVEISSYALSFYIVKLFYPSSLSAVYRMPDAAGNLSPLFRLAPYFLLLVTFSLARASRVRKDVILGGGIFLLPLLMVIQIFPLGYCVVADRYTYVPYIGALFVVGVLVIDALARVPQPWRPRLKALVWAVSLIYSGAFFMVSNQRTEIWKDTITLFDDVLRKDERSLPAYVNKGMTHLHRGELAEAVRNLQRAVEVTPDARCYAIRGWALGRMGRYEEALADYNRAIQMNPRFEKAYTMRGQLLIRMGWKDLGDADLEMASAIRGAKEIRSGPFESQGFF